MRQSQFCLDTLGHLNDGTVGLYQCHETGGNQEWTITKKLQIKHHDLCLSLVHFTQGSMVVMRACDESDNQKWVLRDGNLIQHQKLNICLDSMYVQIKGITAERCNSALQSQKWKFVNKFL